MELWQSFPCVPDAANHVVLVVSDKKIILELPQRGVG
jgi:hypothetical protein